MPKPTRAQWWDDAIGVDTCSLNDDYLHDADRGDEDNHWVRLDAMVATHADADHYGGLRDPIDAQREREADELDTLGTTTQAFYHPGLSPQVSGTDDLGDKRQGCFVDLLEDRSAALAGVTDAPGDAPRLRGWWRDFIAAVTRQQTVAGSPTPIARLSHETGQPLLGLPSDGGGGDRAGLRRATRQGVLTRRRAACRRCGSVARQWAT